MQRRHVPDGGCDAALKLRVPDLAGGRDRKRPGAHRARLESDDVVPSFTRPSVERRSACGGAATVDVDAPRQLHLNEVLITATNSTGGVMGKMIDAQSIMVACAACYEDEYERSHALGPIFRRVWWHSVAGAAVIGIIALLQAYVFTGAIPK